MGLNVLQQLGPSIATQNGKWHYAMTTSFHELALEPFFIGIDLFAEFAER